MITVYKYNFGMKAYILVQRNLQGNTETNALPYESIKILVQRIQAFTGPVALHTSF